MEQDKLEALWEGEMDILALQEGENIRKQTGLTEESIGELAEDIERHGQLQPLLVWGDEWDEEGAPVTATVWDGFRRFAAIQQLAGEASFPVKVRVTTRPKMLGAWQIRANNYNELAPGEVAGGLAPLFKSLRRKDWRKRVGTGQPYTKGAGAYVQEVTGLSSTRASRYGSILVHGDLEALWGKAPGVSLEVMLDAAKREGSERIALFLDSGLVSEATLASVYGSKAVQEASEGDKSGGKGKAKHDGGKRPTVKAQETAMADMGTDDDPSLESRLMLMLDTVADLVPDNVEAVRELVTTAVSHGAIYALAWATGRGPSPVGWMIPTPASEGGE